MSSVIRFQTERLDIRPWTLDDVEAAFVMYGNAEVAKYLNGTPLPNLEAQREKLEMVIEKYSRPEMKNWGNWAIVLRETNELIGAILLKPLPPEEVDIEIGWHLAQHHWHKGYAQEAARRLLEYGFIDQNLQTIHAVTHPENQPSQTLAKRLGLTHQGQTNKYYDQTTEHFTIHRADYLSQT